MGTTETAGSDLNARHAREVTDFLIRDVGPPFRRVSVLQQT